MRHSMLPILVALASAATPLPGFAQESAPPPDKSKTRPFRSAEADDEKVSVGVEVVPTPKLPSIVKEWRLNKAGSTAMGVTVHVTGVQLFSSGIMRWNLSFWNRSNEAQTLYFDFEEMVVADEQSNPHRQVGRQVIAGNRRSIYMRSIPRDQRFNTWVDYEAPQEPTTTFKIGVMLEGRYDHRADAFKPFQVELKEPLFLKDGAFEEVKKAAPAPKYAPGHSGGDRDGDGEADGLVGPAALETPHVCPNPKQLEEREQKFRDLSEGGLRINGNLFLNQGRIQHSGRIIFKPRERGDFVEATIVTLDSPERTFELHGAFFEDHRSETGVALKLRDKAGVVYTFKLDGNSLRGADTLGNRFIFLVTAKK